MEVYSKSASDEITNEVANESAQNEAVCPKPKTALKEETPEKNEQSETKEKTECNGLNGSESPRNADSPKHFESVPHKTSSSSPTLIGSAFKVVKNLFSPEKSKSKHSGVLSPINQQKNAAGAPCGNVCVSGKTELVCSEPGISFQSAEIFKNNFQINETGGIQSPLIIDNLNNTDESFLTTVSLIDDSFHSAITDLDENGDSLRAGANVIEKVLNKSPNYESADSCNDTIETNDSYLENTTLKVGSLTPEGKAGQISIHGKAESPRLLNGGTQGRAVGRDDRGEERTEDGTLKAEEKLGDVRDSKESGEKPSLEEDKTREREEIAPIFLNAAFEKSASEQSGISLNASKSYTVETCKSYKETEPPGKESKILFAAPNQDCFARDSISTTTVVLETRHSQDLDSLAFQATDYDAPASSAYFEENGGLTRSWENVEKAFAANRSQTSKQLSDCCERLRGPAALRIMSPQKKCFSEGSSPCSRGNPAKIKLNKSDEAINRRTSSESPDGNNCLVDIPLMKSVENSELSDAVVLRDLRPEGGKTEVNSPAKPGAGVTSQLSYTILVNDKNVLKRPVIDSPSVASSPKQTFPAQEDKFHCSDGSFDGTSEVKQSTPLWSGNNEKEQQYLRSSLKLHSPQLSDRGEGNETERTFNPRPNLLTKAGDIFSGTESPLKFSPVSPGDGNENPFLNSTGSEIGAAVPDPEKPSRNSSRGNETFEKNAQPPGAAHFPHNLTFDKSPASPKSKRCNSTFVKSRELPETDQTFNVTSPDVAQLNKTYDKPAGQLNQTFDLKADCLGAQKLNETFDTKRPDSPLDSKISQVVGSCQEKVAQETTFDSVPIAETSQRTAKQAESRNSKKPVPNSNAPPPENKSAIGELNESPGSSKNSSDLSSGLLNEEFFPSNDNVDLQEKLQKFSLGETVSLPRLKEPLDEQEEEKLLTSLKEDKLQCDPELVQLIQEQFSSNDIEKICSVVQDLSSAKLSSDIMRASAQFDKSFHGNVSEAEPKPAETEAKEEKAAADPLSPKSFDFLSSIGGKPTGRDWSRESLYVKFDPLVQPTANSLIDFTKEGEVLPPSEDSPANAHNSSICEQLLTISPQKKTADIVPPLTPLSHKDKKDEDESKTERVKELQNEIYFLKNLYAEREKASKARTEEYENQLAKLTGDVCFLEDKVKESNERERCLVKKMKEQTQNIGQLNVIMKEYMNVISRLTAELETLKSTSARQMESLIQEKDSYMTHLQNTEAAFTDVHTKYEKSKKTIASLKANETMFKNTITEQAHKMEELVTKAREIEERSSRELQRVRDEQNETKANHVQETARLRAQLRKTELKVEALQESLDQKIKENQQLTAICDELIEGKK